MSVTVHEGEALVLLGANGAGKSTLLSYVRAAHGAQDDERPVTPYKRAQ